MVELQGQVLNVKDPPSKEGGFAYRQQPRCNVTQIVSKNISKEFSRIRDELGLYDHLKPEERPTYHEIRGLSARLIKAQGNDPQSRMGHSDSKSTKVYTEFGKETEWVQVPNLTVNF